MKHQYVRRYIANSRQKTVQLYADRGERGNHYVAKGVSRSWTSNEPYSEQPQSLGC